MKIHCLYRDFFIFLRMLNLERDHWSTFRRYYFEKHRGFLSQLWCRYQGYTLRNIRERVEALKKEDYADIESALKLYDIEESTREVIQHCKSLLHDPYSCNVYLFIGFFTPDGFVLPYKNDYVICVGLERFHNFKNYDVLLSHEYCHYILNKQGGNDRRSLQDRLIREGISVYFSKIAYPGRKDHAYLFLGEERLRYLETNYRQILEMVKREGAKKVELFSTESKKYPSRSGYFIGYKLIEDFMNRTGIEDIHYLTKSENQILIDF